MESTVEGLVVVIFLQALKSAVRATTADQRRLRDGHIPVSLPVDLWEPQPPTRGGCVTATSQYLSRWTCESHNQRPEEAAWRPHPSISPGGPVRATTTDQRRLRDGHIPVPLLWPVRATTTDQRRLRDGHIPVPLLWPVRATTTDQRRLRDGHIPVPLPVDLWEPQPPTRGDCVTATSQYPSRWTCESWPVERLVRSPSRVVEECGRLIMAKK